MAVLTLPKQDSRQALELECATADRQRIQLYSRSPNFLLLLLLLLKSTFDSETRARPVRSGQVSPVRSPASSSVSCEFSAVYSRQQKHDKRESCRAGGGSPTPQCERESWRPCAGTEGRGRGAAHVASGVHRVPVGHVQAADCGREGARDAH